MSPSDPLSRPAAAVSDTHDAETPHSRSADSSASTADQADRPRESASPWAAAGRYTLGDEIARGGMGVVYRGTDAGLDREVAVKVLQDKFGPRSGTARRFLDEARITGQLQHPGIPPIHDLGTLPDGRPFLVMKLIKGQTLEGRLRGRADLAADRGRLVAAFEQACQAVAYAHAHQVVHRDLKPANVMVGSFGEVQVMDWGLAKVLGPGSAGGEDPEATTGTEVRSLRESDGQFTQEGSVLGTPAYMPPEQAIGAVDQIDARSDVFGLGGILCAILTGRPPFVADSAESARQLAALGKTADAFARLDACGAEPDLVFLCKRCLSRDKEERPADAGEVAKAVADLRAAADERARRAELDRVKAEGEKATAEARAGERRKRRRVWTGAAAALTAAVVLGLAAVLVVQHRANDDLAAKNRELADEQAKVQARFELARKAIHAFHTGVSEDVLLKQGQFQELRTRLLKEAAGFYDQMGRMLEGQTDAPSRKALADGYVQLADLTEKIGSQEEALATHRKALAIRRELAAAPGADVETRLDVARSLGAVGLLQEDMGDTAGAMAAFEEQRDLAKRLAVAQPTDAVRAALAISYSHIGNLQRNTKKPEEALAAYKQARAIQQDLADAHPNDADFQDDLSSTWLGIGVVYHLTARPDEAMAAYREALVIRQKLARENPSEDHYALAAAMIQSNIGGLLQIKGKPTEAIDTYKEALKTFEALAKANPAVTSYQSYLAKVQGNFAAVLYDMDQTEDALAEYKETLGTYQKLADANPAVTGYQIDLARTYNNIGWLDAHQHRLTQALTSLNASMALYQKQVDQHPDNGDGINGLGFSYLYRGWTRVRAGQTAAAAADLREALRLWAKLPTLYIDTRFARSLALSMLAGMGGDPKSGVTPAEAATFADDAVAALRDAVNAGWDQPDDLKKSDFDPIRGREDFRQLVKELESKAPPKEAAPKPAGK